MLVASTAMNNVESLRKRLVDELIVHMMVTCESL